MFRRGRVRQEEPPATESGGGEDQPAKEAVVVSDGQNYHLIPEVAELRGRWELASVLNFLTVRFSYLLIIFSFHGLRFSSIDFLRCLSFVRELVDFETFFFFFQVFKPVIGKDLKISAEEVETGLINPDSSLAKLHITLLKVLLLFYVF